MPKDQNSPRAVPRPVEGSEDSSFLSGDDGPHDPGPPVFPGGVLPVLMAALDVAGNSIVIADCQGRVLWCNSAFKALYGLSLEQSRQHTLGSLCSEQAAVDFAREAWPQLQSGSAWQGEMLNRRPDGGIFVEHQTVTPFRDGSGAISHFIATKQDITARRQIEVELRHARERFDRVFQSNATAMGISTLSEGRFLDVNATFLRLTGYMREEVVGRTGSELGIWISPADRESFIHAVVRDAGVKGFECQCKDKNGSLHHVLISAESVQLGLELCMVFSAVDITDRKDLEARLRQAQKMEAFGQLAGGVAHDFNNILTVIQGHTSILAAMPDLDPDALESLNQIGEASTRASNLTRQLLTFGRKQPFQPARLDANNLVSNLTKMLRRIIGEDVALEFRYSPQLPEVMADGAMLEQVLMNLVVNARDAMPGGGRLVIATALEEVVTMEDEPSSLARPGQFVVLSVQDSGQGIPPEVMPRIFEPFFTTKDVGKGTGLGLATVHGIVEQHQGWVQVQSQPGMGATFRVLLPALPRTTKEPEEPAAKPVIHGGHEVVLLVEDEGSLRELARIILERYGYEVWEASSGPMALELWKVQRDRIQLVLSDIVMPGGMNGHELATELRRDRPDLKVLLMTGYSPDLILREPNDGQPMGLLLKPYTPQELAQAVRQALDGNPPGV